MHADPRTTGERRFTGAGYLLGFSLGGFFDGILLHQVLQWHHLLSAVESNALADVRAQVLFDGLFHALMYVIAACGLWLLYRAREQLAAAPAAGLRVLARGMIGFGAWHVADALLSHWLLGIHRVRMDTASPLAWDLAWLAAVGVPPLVAGIVLRRRAMSRAAAHQPARALRGTALSLAAATLAAGAVAALPPTARDGAATVAVVLLPGVAPAQFLASIGDARIVWSDRAGAVWVLAGGRVPMLDYYRSGALYVSGTVFPAGCAAWLAAPPRSSSI
jgi:uncharacterized membrane protein